MKKIAYLIAAIGLLTTSFSSLGCAWIFMDEPESNNIFND